MPNLQQRDVAGFTATYPSGTRIPPHSHAAHQLINAISGAMRVFVHDKIWFLPVGRALLLPAQVEHAIHCEGVVEMRTAYLSPSHFSVPSDVRVIAASPLAREVLVRLSNDTNETLRRALGDVLEYEINSGSIQQFSLPLPADPRIARIAAGLRSDPASKKPLTRWATELGFSERNLIRRIREETGLTFRELRRQTRLMIALEMLVEGQSVTRVALDVGFETPSAFIHAFRLVTGKTPRQFLIENQ